MNSSNFLSDKEKNIANKYIEDGYYIGPVSNDKTLNWMRNSFIDIAVEQLNINHNINNNDFLDEIHKLVSPSELNDFRLHVIKKINELPNFRQKYFELAKPYLDVIVGNEMAMQSKINLSIQLPGDDSSLLHVHADTWSGDSPFEVVVWIPLVDCYKTKTMYILPPNANKILNKNFHSMAGKDSENLFNSIKNEINWLNIDFGNLLIFNQGLPHGNRVNNESETRWSMNCRFKGLFTPYNDKKLGEFFEPITLRPASLNGINYDFPKLK